MSKRTDWRYLLPPSVRLLSADLTAVLVIILLTNLAVFLPVIRQSPLRILFGLPLVLFVPGYTFIAALFPEAGTGAPETDGESREGIDGIERLALSFGTSIALVPLIGLVLNFTPWGIRLVPIMISISGLSLLFIIIGAQRRQALLPEDRFTVPIRSRVGAARTELFEPDTRADAVLNVVLVLSLLLAVASVGYAVGVPKKGESFSEVYLLTKSDNGTLVADDYPTNFTVGQSRSLYVGIGNHEHRTVNYTIVLKLQKVEFVNNNTTRIRQQQVLHRFHTQLANNQTWKKQHTVTPHMTGKRLRLVYLLYKGNPPANPTINNADREVHLWVNVSSKAKNKTPS